MGGGLRGYGIRASPLDGQWTRKGMVKNVEKCSLRGSLYAPATMPLKSLTRAISC